jgi:predicted DNA-binding helix-hairpin-helix protein
MILRLSILVPLVVLALRAIPVHAVEPIDVNRSTVAELLAVPGMTATWAARIVRFRPYRTKLELLDQGVVTPEVYRRIREGVVAHRVATAH